MFFKNSSISFQGSLNYLYCFKPLLILVEIVDGDRVMKQMALRHTIWLAVIARVLKLDTEYHVIDGTATCDQIVKSSLAVLDYGIHNNSH